MRVDARLGAREGEPGERVEQIVQAFGPRLHAAGLEDLDLVVRVRRRRRRRSARARPLAVRTPASSASAFRPSSDTRPASRAYHGRTATKTGLARSRASREGSRPRAAAPARSAPKGRVSGTFQSSRTSVMVSCVRRQPVELRAELGGEAFQPVERARLLEGDRRTARSRHARCRCRRSRKSASLALPRMRRAVGAEEELRVAGGGRLDQRLAVLLALEHRQAVVVRPDAAEEERVAVQEQVVRGDGGRDVRPGHLDELRRRRAW